MGDWPVIDELFLKFAIYMRFPKCRHQVVMSFRKIVSWKWRLLSSFGTFCQPTVGCHLSEPNIQQGCDCAANWLLLANSDPNFVISEISVNQVRKCFPAWGVGVFTIQEQSCKCPNCRRLLRILANFTSIQSHP